MIADPIDPLFHWFKIFLTTSFSQNFRSHWVQFVSVCWSQLTKFDEFNPTVITWTPSTPSIKPWSLPPYPLPRAKSWSSPPCPPPQCKTLIITSLPPTPVQNPDHHLPALHPSAKPWSSPPCPPPQCNTLILHCVALDWWLFRFCISKVMHNFSTIHYQYLLPFQGSWFILVMESGRVQKKCVSVMSARWRKKQREKMANQNPRSHPVQRTPPSRMMEHKCITVRII